MKSCVCDVGYERDYWYDKSKNKKITNHVS